MLLVALIWGVNFSVMKLAIAEIPPLAFTAVRFLSASLLLWLVLRLREGAVAFPPGSFWRLVLLGVVGNTFYQLAFILGLAQTSATNSALLISTVPTVVALLGGALGIERVTARVGWGIAVATAGVVIVVAARGVAFSSDTLQGDLLMIVAVFCWAGYTIGLRPLAGKISPLRVTTFTMLTGTPGLLLAGLPQLARLDWGTVGLVGWGGLIYAVVFSLTLAYILFNASVRAIGASRTAIYLCVTPAFAALVAWFLLGERPHPLQAVGAVLIVAGVLLARRPGPESAPLDPAAVGSTR